MNLKNRLNLNSYEWWRNHRKIISYGGFLIVFAIYLSPLVKEAKNKNKCISIAHERFMDEALKNDRISRESSFVLAYQVCNHRSN
tara:strand:- start:23651 stop:23905 length:255 start_codon:yes stop_codon:yes gene_type:complete